MSLDRANEGWTALLGKDVIGPDDVVYPTRGKMQFKKSGAISEVQIEDDEANGRTVITFPTTAATAVFGTLVAAARAAVPDLAEDEIYHLVGYTTPGDGGGGYFRKSSANAVDDGGTVLNEGGLGTNQPGLRRIYSGPLDARWFGFKAGGTGADNATALGLALDVADGGGTVLAPDGTYALASQIDFSNRSAVTLRGQPNTVFEFDVADIAIGGGTVSDCTIESLKVSGKGSRMIAFSAATRVKILDCNVSGASLDSTAHEPSGIWLSGSTDCQVRGCVVGGNGRQKVFTADAGTNTFTSVAHGFLNNDQVHVYGGTLPPELVEGTNYHVINRTADTFQLSATEGGAAIDISTAGSGTLTITLLCYDIFAEFSGHTRLDVSDNHCVSTETLVGILVENALDSKISGNLVTNVQGSQANDGYGICASQTTTAARIAIVGNTVRTTSGSGIYLRGAIDCAVVGNTLSDTCKTMGDLTLNVAAIAATTGPNVISGNMIEDSGKSGISWSSAGGIGCTVVGNSIRTVASHGIWIRGSASNSVVVGNQIVSPGSRGIFADSALVNVVCSSNFVLSSGNNGIDFAGGLMGVINGNMVDNSGFAGIVAISYGDGLIISGNRVRTAAYVGIYAAVTQASITDNVVNDAGDVGIYCSSDDSRISGNRISGCAKSGIRSTGDRCDISENNLIGNDVDGYDISGVDTSIHRNRLTDGPREGIAGLASGTVTVATTEIQDGDVVRLTRVKAGGSPGHLSLGTITDGTSFVITSSSGADDGTVRWEIEKARPWSPALVSGTTWLLRASQTTLGDAAALTTWTDEGSAGVSPTQGTPGKRPTHYDTGGPKNGHRIRFSTAVLEKTGDPFAALTACHAFVVMKVDNDPATVAAGAWKIGNAGSDAQVPYSDGNIYDDWGSTTRKNFGDPAASMASWCVYEIISTPSEKTALVNGVQVGTDATNTVDFAATVRIGAADATPTNYMIGDIAEIFQADHKLTATERAEYALHVLRDYGIAI